MKTFEELQAGLGAVMAANTEGSGTPHVVIAMPSYSLNESFLSHYGNRILALEHRYLLSGLMTHRIADVRWIYLSSIAPGREVLDYYRDIGPRPADFAASSTVVSLGDRGSRCMSDKLLARPEVIDRLRRMIDGRPAVIEPWNVTEHEVAVAEQLQVPVNGMDPRLRHLGFKSAGRRLFHRAGVPVPYGREDVRTVDDVLAAIASLRAARPDATAVVVKLDDSGAGDGNVVIDLCDPLGAVARLPAWFVTELRAGGVVEELVVGETVTSPSAQIDLTPGGRVDVLATHEQVLGGDSGQIFLGCRFPADAAYSAELARYGAAIGKHLAAAGVLGRVSVDFAATRSAAGGWRLYALEMNLRKGGTTHPYGALRNLVPGRYDSDAGRWIARDGSSRAYVCTDNMVDEAWLGLAADRVIRAVRDAGLQFDHRTGVGVLLHMLSGLDIDGRIGLTAVGLEPVQAQTLYDDTRQVLAGLTAATRSA